MSVKFGTSGLRGLSVDLQGRPSYVYPAAFVNLLLRNGHAKSADRVLVGYDFRDSSPAIAANAMIALRQSGLVPVDCGHLPTPALAYYGFQAGLASLMVTGSHIPADRNGIKFYLPDGEIGKSDERQIAEIAAELNDMPVPALGEITSYENRAGEAVALFMERNKIVLPESALSGKRFGVYQHSTVARDMLSEILRYYGAEVVELGRSSVFTPVDTEAVSAETIAALREWSYQFGLDAVVSADGDGDRPLIADETGSPISGDICGYLTALFLGADAIVTPITSNSGIKTAGGVEVVRTKVGSPFVIAGMQEALASHRQGVVGFEANGGTLTASEFRAAKGTLRPLPTRDSFLPVLAVLGSAAAAGLKLSGLKDRLGLPFTAADRLEKFATERSVSLMARLQANRENLSEFLHPLGLPIEVDMLDGLRVTLDNGRTVHFRPSGNAPEMRCYVEAANAAETREVLEMGLRLLREADLA
ncbi:phosphomannomutase [Sinorhizobium sp. BJ1]|uniref:phosphomannomutase n=1 Tax=Sinorhizobium sp. BJ1 TaxID=2035455 RepID=UPI000BE7E1A8|nr:phosphomannomutase [Sinorhizobium sp. BJ1]PDT80354.1 phosphomannomutase [Sinorhizobium sp. BJ1]